MSTTRVKNIIDPSSSLSTFLSALRSEDLFDSVIILYFVEGVPFFLM
jgi:hypothetical protein